MLNFLVTVSLDPNQAREYQANRSVIFLTVWAIILTSFVGTSSSGQPDPYSLLQAALPHLRGQNDFHSPNGSVKTVVGGDPDMLNEPELSTTSKSTHADTTLFAEPNDDDESMEEIDQPKLVGQDDEEQNQKNWYQLVLLAREEIQCLETFDGFLPERKLLDFDNFLGFTCPTNSSACQECRQMTQNFEEPGGCSRICETSTSSPVQPWSCPSYCDEMTSRTKSRMLRIPQQIREQSPQSLQTYQRYFPTQLSTTIGGSIQVFCEGVIPAVSSDSSSSGHMLRHSENNNRGTNLHFVVVKIKLASTNFTYYDKTDASSPNYPVVFVIEERWCHETEGNCSELSFSTWKTTMKTSDGLIELPVDFPGAIYEWRATVVSGDGIVAQFTSPHYRTLKDYVKPTEPKNVKVVRTDLSESGSSVNVLIGWDPPEGKSCLYKIQLDTGNGRTSKPRTTRVKRPLGFHGFWFQHLGYGSSFHVLITSRNPQWTDESTHAGLDFTTPTCLQVHNFSFAHCSPPPPRSIKSHWGPQDNDKLTLLLSWNPPLYTSASNKIEKYTVTLSTFIFPAHIATAKAPVNGVLGSREFAALPSVNTSLPILNGTQLGPWHVNGTTTSLQIDNLKSGKDYEIQVVAESIYGRTSPSARLIVQAVVPEKLNTDNAVGFRFLHPVQAVILPLLMLLVSAFSYHILRNYMHKRKIKAARTRYFKSMDDKDGGGDELSVVPLNDEPILWLEFEGMDTKEAFEIEYTDMVLGDVIGQGAFGIVRKATITRRKFDQLWKKQAKSKRLRLSSQNHTVSARDAVDVEEVSVAVKILKVGNSCNEKEELIKEIVTMQSLGSHPQIVSLLGACTKGRSLCMVLEYCPGGDLLTFLRQYREEHLPLLNMGVGGKRPISPTANSSAKVQHVKPSLNSDSTLLKQSSSELRGSFGLSPLQNSSDSSGKSTEGSDSTTVTSNKINYANINKFASMSESSIEKEELSETRPAGSVLLLDESTGENSPSLSVFNPMYSAFAFEPLMKVDERQVLSYARQIALGMEYLERHHIVHRDLACRNILLTDDKRHIKISDFGLSRDIYTWNVYHQKTDSKMPVKWMAIESIFGQVFSSKSDVWSFGIVLWELVTLGGNPYPGINNNELFSLLKNGYRMERPENCSEELYALMKKCWRSTPIDRPKFTELTLHLETLLETEDPTLYLSLQPDLPAGFYSMSEFKFHAESN